MMAAFFDLDVAVSAAVAASVAIDFDSLFLRGRWNTSRVANLLALPNWRPEIVIWVVAAAVENIRAEKIQKKSLKFCPA